MTRSKQQLFVFSQFFDSRENFSLETFLRDFDINFETEQQRNWEKFWGENGEEITLQQWKQKYSNYISDTAETETELESKLAHEDQTNVNGEISTEIHTNEVDADGWSILWQNHCEETYIEQYEFFTSAFYSYYIDFKSFIEESLLREEKQTSEEEKQRSFYLDGESIANDFEQLRLLGLPTAFGCRSTSYRKKKLKELESEADVGAYSSDSVSVENDYDTDSGSDSEIEIENEDFTFSIMDLKDETKSSADAKLHTVQKNRRKPKKCRKLRMLPEIILKDKSMIKYWHKRFSLFSRFNEGIKLDKESWFSVTPEKIAKHLAERIACDIIVDGFCGCGGNAIQFAKTCRRVIAIDIDPSKVEMAKHNAAIYGVANKIDFIVGDFLQLASDGSKLYGDVVFLSPPWGGPKYKNINTYDIERNLLPVSASKLMELARNISENVVLFLPKNSITQQIVKLAGEGNQCEIEHNYLDSKLNALTVFYGKDIITNKCANT